MAPDFGLEALYKLQPIRKPADAVILLVHFVLTKNGWRYVGRGDTWSDSDQPTESLPQGWADSTENYRYVSRLTPPKKFTLKFVQHENFLLVNMVSMSAAFSVSMNINLNTEVDAAQLSSNVPRQVYPNLLQLISTIHEKLVQPCEVSTKTVGTTANIGGHQEPRPRMEPRPYARPADYSIDPPGALPLGRRDLDPFAGPGEGGGMILDPLRVYRNDPRGPDGPLGPIGPDGNRLPPGARPPGARFDPFIPDLGPELNPFFPRGPRGPGLDPFGGGFM